MNNLKGINTDNAVSWASYTSKRLVLLGRKLPRGLLGRSLCPSTKPFCCLGSVRNQTSLVAWATVWPETYTHQPQILARRTLHYWLSSPTEPLSAYRSLLDPMCVDSLRVWQVSIGSHSGADRPSIDQWAQGGGTEGSDQVLVWSCMRLMTCPTWANEFKAGCAAGSDQVLVWPCMRLMTGPTWTNEWQDVLRFWCGQLSYSRSVRWRPAE
jgi:hypothetical protein